MHLPEEKDLLVAQEAEAQQLIGEEILSKKITWRDYSGSAKKLESKEAGMLMDYCEGSREDQTVFFF